MATSRPAIPIRPPRRPGHPPLTTRAGRLVIYVVCKAGRGRDQIAISSYFSVSPSASMRSFRAGYRQWLIERLAEGDSETNRFPDPSRWRCFIQPSLGDLPEGSNAVEIE